MLFLSTINNENDKRVDGISILKWGHILKKIATILSEMVTQKRLASNKQLVLVCLSNSLPLGLAFVAPGLVGVIQEKIGHVGACQSPSFLIALCLHVSEVHLARC